MLRYHKKRSRKTKSRRNPSKRRKSRSRSRRRSNPSRKRRSALKGRKFSNFKRVRSHKRRVNPSRRRRVSRRRNPSGIKGLMPSTGFLMQAATVVAGFIGGKFLMSKIPVFGESKSIVNKVAPAALSIIAGAFMVSKSNKHVKSIGIGLAASGVAQLLTSFVPQLQNVLGVDLSGDDIDSLGYTTDANDVVRVGDEMVQVGADLGNQYDMNDDSSVYEMI